MLFGSKREKDLIQVNYEGEIPQTVVEFLNTTRSRPQVIEKQPLVLSVERDHDFVEQLLSVIRNSQFKVQNVELRKQA